MSYDEISNAISNVQLIFALACMVATAKDIWTIRGIAKAVVIGIVALYISTVAFRLLAWLPHFP